MDNVTCAPFALTLARRALRRADRGANHRFRTAAPPLEVLWRLVLRVPNQWTPAVAQAATTRTEQIFLGFSRFPDARAFVDPGNVTTVRWTGVRFAGGLLTLQPPARQPAPLAVTVGVGGDRHILREQFGQ